MKRYFAVLSLIATPALAQTAPAPFDAPPVPSEALDKVAGRADVIQQVRASNTSSVANNSINGDSTTGAIQFDANAFDNMHGLSVLSANTGNNVAINSSLNVNVSIRP